MNPQTSSSLVTRACAAQPEAVRRANAAFLKEARPHALLITNHGYAGPSFPAGAPDSGGQITYVNSLARLLADHGYKVTVASRAFTPDEQFASFGNRTGVAFMTDAPMVRYAFIPGLTTRFVAKEQIYAELPAIADNLAHFIADEAHAAGALPWDYIAWINTHYVDAGTIGQIVIAEWQAAFARTWTGSAHALATELNKLNRHAFTPHSLGKLKEHNMQAMDEELRKTELFKMQFAAMNFPLREHLERALIGGIDAPHSWMGTHPRAAALVTTSAEIKDTLAELDAATDIPLINFPPGTDIAKYFPRASIRDPEIKKLFDYMKDMVPASVMEKIASNPQGYNVIVEAGRMDPTKRKEIPIEAMTHLPNNTLMFITGKKDKAGVYDELARRIEHHALKDRVFLLGMVPDELMAPLMSLPHGTQADQFRVAIGVSASRMEGWGMAAMDMTAGGMPLVASPLVPYATHLKSKDPESVRIVPLDPEEPAQYAHAFKALIDRPTHAATIAENGRKLAQDFDWHALVKRFAQQLQELFQR